MGDHYIPQFYLKGFTEAKGDDCIWVFEREKEVGFYTKVKSIANERKLYSKEIESYLANEIEFPATPVIEKIRNGHHISNEDKLVLASYLIIMLKRVPNHKRWVQQKSPEFFDKFLDDIDKQIVTRIAENPEKKEIYEKRRIELAEKRKDKYFREALTLDMWLDNLKKDRSDQIINILASMTWLFWTAKDEVFITSDNPLFFFSSIGIGNEKSEVSFPISKDIALWATWRKDIGDCTYQKGKEKVLHEINRRTIKNATRYIFCDGNYDWVPKLLNKQNLEIGLLIYGSR